MIGQPLTKNEEGVFRRPRTIIIFVEREYLQSTVYTFYETFNRIIRFDSVDVEIGKTIF